MKNPIYLILLLALGLVFVSYKWVSSGNDDKQMNEPEGNPVLENIMTRASVRSYSDRKIGKETVDTLLRAAMAAPTAGNKQPWRFVVIESRATLDKIGNNFGSMTMAKEAPLAIVMCGDTSETFEGEGREYWVQDVSAASENLLLAAHSIGLGAVWCGIYPLSERVKVFSEMLELPENIIPMACICVGYPSGEVTPKDKWEPGHIHHVKWSE